MSAKDWRSASDYDDLKALDAPGLAWEFLRRNPKFAAERAELERNAQNGEADSSAVDDHEQRWGVRFHRREGGDDCGCPEMGRMVHTNRHRRDRLADLLEQFGLPVVDGTACFSEATA